MKDHGVKAEEWSISEQALRDMIRLYTRESGVRNLEREMANLIRKAVKEIALGKATTVSLNRRNLEKYAGVPRYRYGEAEVEDMVGVSTGLAWTEVGGELLTIEAALLPGKGKVTTTGKLGDVMKESIQAAESFVKSRAVSYGIKPTLFERRDIHVHVPEGATPKDGPSAGIAMVTAIVSVLTQIPVRHNVAMTGEVTLRGRVLPIGGLKEKLLAALRANIKIVLIPKENEKDLADIPDNVKRKMEIIPVSSADEVLAQALVKELTAIEWNESDDDAQTTRTPKGGDEHPGVLTH
jgi:ATP-dependent Lon protease